MKFGTSFALLAFALISNGEASSLTDVNDDASQHLRSRRLQETAASAAATPETPAAAAATPPMASVAPPMATAAMGAAAATKFPVKKLKYHIGGGSYNDIKVLNNIGYAFMGYDLIKGNPLDTSGLVKVDQGFRNPIFDTEKYELMVDREYYAPEGLNVVECEGCNTNAQSKVLESLSDYVDSLEIKIGAGVGFSAGVVKGAFSASYDYKQAKEMMSKVGSTSTESEISCCVYQAELSAYQLPPYSANFLAAVALLKAAAKEDEGEDVSRKLKEGEAAPVPETKLKKAIQKFVHEFGTHYVKKVTMGSLFGEQTYISAENTREMKQKGIDIRVAASVSVASTVDVNANFGLNSDVKETQEFLSKTDRKATYSRGAKPVGGGDTDLWLAYSSDNPVPTHTEILPIQDLDAYGDPKIVQAIKDYVTNYCEEVNGAECDIKTSEIGMDGKGTYTHYNPSRYAGKYQPSFIEAKSDPFEHNTNYETKASWFITGLTGEFVNGNGKYSAIVSDMGVNIVHDTGNIGWTGWSDYDKADRTCPPNQVVVGIKSHIGHSGDRRFGLNCASVRGLEVSDEGLSEDMLSMLDLDKEIPMLNVNTVADWDANFEDKCPFNHVLVGFMSVRRQSKYSDMRWKIKCGLIRTSKRQVDTVSVTPTWNRFHENFYYSSPSQAVLQGFIGDFSASKKDTRFKFAEYWMESTSMTVGSSWSKDWEFDAVDSEQEFTCGGQALTGFISKLEGGRRNFKFECRGISNHKLLHANREDATATSGTKEADWTGDWVGEGSSFGIACEEKRVLAGVKVKYVAAVGDYAWQARCLMMERN